MFGSRKAKKEIAKLKKSRPKYEIQDEAFQNQNIARSEAYGQDRGIQMQQQKLEQDAATSVSAAKEITDSTSGLLSTIAAIDANKNDANRSLSQDAATLRNQKMQQLLGVNNQMIDEKDKAWNYNVNEPYQLKIAEQREKLKRAQAISDSFSGVAIAVGSNAATSGSQTSQNGQSGDSGNGQAGVFGMLGSIFSDERLKHSVSSLEYGINEVLKLKPVNFIYNDTTEKHLGFIAQDVNNVIPEVVFESSIDEHGSPVAEPILMIKPYELIPVLVRAMQQQQAEIEALKKEIHSIKNPA